MSKKPHFHPDDPRILRLIEILRDMARQSLARAQAGDVLIGTYQDVLNIVLEESSDVLSTTGIRNRIQVLNKYYPGLLDTTYDGIVVHVAKLEMLKEA